MQLSISKSKRACLSTTIALPCALTVAPAFSNSLEEYKRAPGSEKIISPKTVPAGTDLLKVDNGNTGTMEICLKITIRTLTRRQ